MNNGPKYSYRRLNAAGSAVALSIVGGATLKGVWISSRTATATIRFDDAAASVTATAGNLIPTTILSAPLGWREMGGIATGKGLFFRNLSCNGVIVYTPGGGG